jgi:hypothetical protein
MPDSIAERFLEDEGLSEGLTDQQAHELVDWLISIAEDLDEPAYVSQLQRIGREIAKISRDYGIPVETLIDLVELAWEDPDAPPNPVMRA